MFKSNFESKLKQNGLLTLKMLCMFSMLTIAIPAIGMDKNPTMIQHTVKHWVDALINQLMRTYQNFPSERAEFIKKTVRNIDSTFTNLLPVYAAQPDGTLMLFSHKKHFDALGHSVSPEDITLSNTEDISMRWYNAILKAEKQLFQSYCNQQKNQQETQAQAARAKTFNEDEAKSFLKKMWNLGLEMMKQDNISKKEDSETSNVNNKEKKKAAKSKSKKLQKQLKQEANKILQNQLNTVIDSEVKKRRELETNLTSAIKKELTDLQKAIDVASTEQAISIMEKKTILKNRSMEKNKKNQTTV